MVHSHDVTDTDLRFTIKPSTRTIINLSGKVALVQDDHNSERFTFEVPRYIDGHDMSLCDYIEIHYLNGDHPGIYDVDDMQIDSQDDSVIIFTWLISRNSTQISGPLAFAIRFKCMNGEVISYAWNTAVHTGITILRGINNDDILADQYTDEYVETLTKWEQQFSALETSIQEAENERTAAESVRISAETDRVAAE